MERQMLYMSRLEKLEYIIEFKIINGNILIKMKENNEFVPYTYEGLFSHDDFIEHHRAFKSCVNVQEILAHLTNLYNNENVIIGDVGKDNCRYITFKILYISSEENTLTFELERKMVEDKDKALIESYEELKRKIKIIKQIEQLVNSGEIGDDNELLRRNILDILSNDGVFNLGDDYL